MKLFTLISLISLIFLLNSCCKNNGPYPVAALTVKYSSLSNSGQLQAIRTNRNNMALIIDTISLGALSTSNSFSTIIEFEEKSPNYILFIAGTSYHDTLSDINFERKKGCKETIKNFEYKFNGQLKTDKNLIIN